MIRENITLKDGIISTANFIYFGEIEKGLSHGKGHIFYKKNPKKQIYAVGTFDQGYLV